MQPYSSCQKTGYARHTCLFPLSTPLSLLPPDPFSGLAQTLTAFILRGPPSCVWRHHKSVKDEEGGYKPDGKQSNSLSMRVWARQPGRRGGTSPPAGRGAGAHNSASTAPKGMSIPRLVGGAQPQGAQFKRLAAKRGRAVGGRASLWSPGSNSAAHWRSEATRAGCGPAHCHARPHPPAPAPTPKNPPPRFNRRGGRPAAPARPGSGDRRGQRPACRFFFAEAAPPRGRRPRCKG